MRNSIINLFNKKIGGFQSYRAFTLAEVLITLSIIGIVAQMTLPTLTENVNKQVYVTQLKTIYSEVGSAVKMMMVDEGVNYVTDSNLLTVINSAPADPGTFLKKYFKVVKDCGQVEATPCLAPYYKNLPGTAVFLDLTQAGTLYCVILANGMSLCLRPGQSPSGVSVSIAVDVNGLKQPNQAGRDLFAFNIYYDGSIDSISPGMKKENASALRTANAVPCLQGISYGGCFGKILNDGWKMDY